MTTQRSGFFVGREKEHAQLVSVLDRACDGAGRIALIAGEPGIGKTALVNRVVETGDDARFNFHRGQCTEHSGAPALWPWTQAVRSLIRAAPGDHAECLDPNFADLATLIPELAPSSQFSSLVHDAAPAESDFRLFESFTRFLTNATSRQPLVLVLEDLHWADQLSLGLLAHLAPVISSMPLLVIGTYRDVELSRTHPLANTLAYLHSFDLTRISLLPLSPGETSYLLDSLSGKQHETEISQSIHDRSAGNPLFVSEIAKSISTGQLDPSSERVPEGIREAIGERLNRLSTECNDFLQDCSLIDSGFDLQFLSLLFPDTDADRLLDLIEEGERHGFIRADDVGRAYEFTHALFRQTLASELSLGRRIRLHGRIGEALLQRYGNAANEHAEELALHFVGAEAITGPEKAIHFSIAAGEHALESFAYADARRHFISASELFDGADTDTRIAIKFGLGRVLIASNLHEERAQGWDHLVEAFDLAIQAGDKDRAIRMSLYPAIVGGLARVPVFYKRALQFAPPDSFESGWLKARYGMALSDTGEIEKGRTLIEEAIELSEKIDSDRLRARAKAHLLQNRMRGMDHVAVTDLYQEVIDLAAPIGDYGSIARIGSFGVISLISLGRPDDAKELLNQVKPMRMRMGRPEWIASIIDDEASIARLTANWDLFKTASEELAKYDFRGQANLAVLEYTLHGKPLDSKRLLEAADKALDGGEGRVYWTLVGTAGIAMDSGDVELLKVRRTGERLFRFHDNPENRLRYLLADAFIAIAEKDRESATKLLEQLQSISGRAHSDLNIVGDRILARLSALTGDTDRTASYFQAAITFARDSGYLPELAHSCADYCEWLLENGTEDHAFVSGIAEEGLDTSTNIRMRPLIERLERIVSQLPSKAAARNPDGLSDREVEVLALLGTGLSNQEIAEKLFISRYTVVRHVANIYDKSGLSNRSEATAYAHRNGLVPDS